MAEVSMVERIEADRLQQRTEELRDVERSNTMHRRVGALGHGWVEIQAEFLSHLLDRLEAATHRLDGLDR